MQLRKLRIRDACTAIDAPSGQEVYDIHDPHTLIQAAGYLKHVLGKSNGDSVYFRGQTALYPSLSPSLYRGLKVPGRQSSRVQRLNNILKQLRSECGIFSKFNDAVHEPLLQHYGVNTSWLDIVDNVWIALWFACHTAKAIGHSPTFLHWEKRSAAREPKGYAYIILISVNRDKCKSDGVGHYCGNETELVDLRVATPSIFLRPHAQHGLLFRMRGNEASRPLDYSKQIADIIRVSLVDALNWLGIGQMLDARSLFPPAFFDRGYSILLASKFVGSRSTGSINRVEA